MALDTNGTRMNGASNSHVICTVVRLSGWNAINTSLSFFGRKMLLPIVERLDTDILLFTKLSERQTRAFKSFQTL